MKSRRNGVAPVGGNDAAVGCRVVSFQVSQQRGRKIKAHQVEIAQHGVGEITIGGDLLVTIVERSCVGVTYHLACEGILTRRQTEMTVNAEVFQGNLKSQTP